MKNPPKNAVLAVRMDKTLHKKLVLKARRAGTSHSTVVRALAQAYVDGAIDVNIQTTLEKTP